MLPTATGPYRFKTCQTLRRVSLSLAPGNVPRPSFRLACLTRTQLNLIANSVHALDGHRPHDQNPLLPATPGSICSSWLFFVLSRGQHHLPSTCPRLGTVTPFLCCPSWATILCGFGFRMYPQFHYEYQCIGSQVGLGTQHRLSSHMGNDKFHTLQQGLDWPIHTSLYSLQEQLSN